MNSYLLATGDPSRSTLRLFQEGNFHLQLTVTSFQFLQARPLVHCQFRVESRFLLLLVLFHPTSECLWVQLKIPGDFRDRLA